MYAEEPRLRYRVFVHDDPKDTLAHYTALTGRAQLPAPWVFGPRRRVDRGRMVDGVPEAQALRAARRADDDGRRRHPLPPHRLRGRRQERRFAAYNASVHALGFKAIGYYNPYVSVSNTAPRRSRRLRAATTATSSSSTTAPSSTRS